MISHQIVGPVQIKHLKLLGSITRMVQVCCAVFPEYGHPILLGETFPLLNLCHKSAFDLLINKELNNIYNIGIWRDSFLTELDLYDRR